MIVRVGMADAQAAQTEDSLRTLGLGSCVGVALYDPVAKIGGLAHIMLPDHAGREDAPLAKFADTGVPFALTLMEQLGAVRRRITAKLAGGAQMFAGTGNDSLRVGPRNVEAVYKALGASSIAVIAADVGDHYGRTIELFCTDGRLSVRSARSGETWL